MFVMPSDRFCGSCGSGQNTPDVDVAIRLKRRAAQSGMRSRKRGGNSVFKLITALVFWGAVIGVCYAVFGYLTRDIPWPDVMAVVTGRSIDTEEGRGAAVSASDDASGSADMPPIAPDASGDAAIEGVLAPEVKPAWGEPDENGYSALEAQGSGAENLAFRGVVKGKRVRLREEPNVKSQILGHADAGQEFTVTRRYWSGQEKYHWFRVNSGSDSGWMYGEYLRVIED
jgi:hypothetical protein